MILRNKGKIITILIIFILVLYTLGFPNYLRYKIENRFSEPNTYFYGVTFAIMVDHGYGYDAEFDLFDGSIVEKFPDGDKEYYIYGKFINSAEPLVVVVNDKVVYNGHPSSELLNFYEDEYIKKNFVVKLKNFYRYGENKVILSTGNVNKVYFIKSK